MSAAWYFNSRCLWKACRTDLGLVFPGVTCIEINSLTKMSCSREGCCVMDRLSGFSKSRGMDLSEGFRLVSANSDNMADKVRSQIGCGPNLAETSACFDLALVDSSSQVQLLISIDDGKVVSFLGRDKSSPSRHLVSLLAPFFRHSGIRPGFDNTATGFVIDSNGRPVEIMDMPNGLRISGDVNLRYSTLQAFPDGLHVDGSLDVSHSSMEYLGVGLRVEGRLDISHTDIFNLPVDLHVEGDLLAHASNIRRLPDGLHVAGTAYFGYLD